MTERIETDLLAELIGQKHEILVRLRELGQQQSATVAAAELTEMLSVLSEKQALLDELQGTERKLDPFRDQDPDSRTWRSPDDRARCRQAAERCESLLKEIMLNEQQCESELARRRDDAATQLQGTHDAAQVRNAYTSSTGREQNRIDLTAE